MAAQGAGDTASTTHYTGGISPLTTSAVRIFGWGVLACLLAFLINNYLNFWLGWPGATAPFQNREAGTPGLAWLQLAAYPIGVAIAAVLVSATSTRTLREDSVRISRMNAFIIRAAFFAVLYVGLADAAISFLRVEGLLPALVGDEMTLNLGRSAYRGPYIHMPLIGLGIVTAVFTRTLGFTWLALLVVGAELLIVITRFIFSYEQAFMGDLVRFWYAALFLFASAYTLIEEGHVRVDVFYSGFDARKRGWVNALGSLVLGISFCWVILAMGMSGKSDVINSPILAWETTQTGFGMYVKYLMAGFLAIFALSMMIQFVSYMMDAVADLRGEPGGRDHSSHGMA
jgi:TRAP-type mannitol/chloroaromatic compound transport system permease small subunit